MRVYNHKTGREQDIKEVLISNANAYDYRRSAAEYITELETLLKDVSGMLYIASLRPNGKLNSADLTEINKLRGKLHANRS